MGRETYEFQRAGVSGGILVLFDVANAAHQTKIERGGVQALGFAVVHEGVLVGIARGVVGLRNGADDSRQRGQRDEEVEVLGQKFVKVPCAYFMSVSVYISPDH